MKNVSNKSDVRLQNYGVNNASKLAKLEAELLRTMPIQMQDKCKGTQSKHAERVERFMQTTSCTLYPKRYNTDKANVWKQELTELSNLNIYFVGYLSDKGKHGFFPLD